MKKIMKLGLFALLGLLITLTPSCTKDIKDDIDTIKTEMAKLSLTTDVDAKLAAINSQLTTLNAAAVAEIAAVKASVTTANEKIANLIATGATKADVDAEKAKLAALTARVATLETWKSDAESRLIALRSELNQAKIDISTNSGKIMVIADSIASYHNSIIKLDAQIETLLGNTAIMKDSLINYDLRLIAQAAKISDNARMIAENKSAYQDSVAAIWAKIGTAEIQGTLVDNIKSNSDSISSLRNDIDDLISQLYGVGSETDQSLLGSLTSRMNDLYSEETGIWTKVTDETNARIEACSTITANLNALTTRVAVIEGYFVNGSLIELVSIKSDINNLKERIQAINFVSEYSDGKATIHGVSDGTDIIAVSDMSLKFRIYPAAQAKNIAAQWAISTAEEKAALASMFLTEVKTRANAAALTITNIELGTDPLMQGIIVVAVTASDFNPKVFANTTIAYNAALEINNSIDKTASNIFGILVNTLKTESDFAQIDPESTSGETVEELTLGIKYTNNTTTYDLNKMIKLGEISSSNTFVKFIDNFGGYEFYTKVVKLTSNKDTGDAKTDTEIISKADKTNFKFDPATKKISINAVDAQSVGNEVVVTINTYIKAKGAANDSADKLISVDDFTIAISPVDIVYNYDNNAFNYTWAQNMDAISANGKIKTAVRYDSLVALEGSPYTLAAELHTALQNMATKKITVTDAEGVDVTSDFTEYTIGQTAFGMVTNPAKVRWDGSVYTVIMETILKSGQKIIVNTKISFSFPAITLNKAELFWNTDKTAMFVKGETITSNNKQVFGMEGDLNKGVDGLGTLPIGVEFVVTADAPVASTTTTTWDIATNRAKFTEYLVPVSASAKLVYTSTTVGINPISIPVSNFTNFGVLPVSPVEATIAESVATWDKSTVLNTGIDLTKNVKLNSILYNTEAIYTGSAFATTVTSSNSSETANVYYGLEAPAFSFTETDIKAPVNSIEAIKKAITLTPAGNFKFDYTGIALNQDVKVNVNVSITNTANLWIPSTGVVVVTIKKNS